MASYKVGDSEIGQRGRIGATIPGRGKPLLQSAANPQNASSHCNQPDQRAASPRLYSPQYGECLLLQPLLRVCTCEDVSFARPGWRWRRWRRDVIRRGWRDVLAEEARRRRRRRRRRLLFLGAAWRRRRRRRDMPKGWWRRRWWRWRRIEPIGRRWWHCLHLLLLVKPRLEHAASAG